MPAGRLLFIILSFFGVAVLVILVGQLAADYALKGALTQARPPENAAPALAIAYFSMRFVIIPIIAVVCAFIVARWAAKSDISLF
ncbi:hypothetical protein J2W51_002309 [Tardiphaga robiniae]|uniref:hypothetical protein n=1 Tax=Tardiphaga robiniae TaxID=943830 RepID=UPI002856EAB8|nr:hypothetical protein [Tardiphaga robiniae]MDR6659739.1 hypothetical protein [Tardiphaga robiniae]